LGKPILEEVDVNRRVIEKLVRTSLLIPKEIKFGFRARQKGPSAFVWFETP
jgi:hypothetical protein